MLLGRKMRVFRATDYNIYIWLDRWRPVMPLLFNLGEAMGRVDSRLALTRFDDQSFNWSLANGGELVTRLVEAFLEVRGDAIDVNSFNAVFDTEVGIDLVTVIRLLPGNDVRMSVANVRFNLEHTQDEEAPLSYNRLFELFSMFITLAQPEHAEVMHYPPITETWYEELRVSIDLTQVPITIQWLNYFNWEWVDRLGGKRKMQQIPEGEVIEVPSGMILVMQHDPFSYQNPEHVAGQRRLDKYFRLAKLHRRYRKPLSV
ncbi:MAG: hypothetical protein WCF84_27415 [Anaerolineae bacterium]